MASDSSSSYPASATSEKISGMQSLMIEIIQALKLYCERSCYSHKNEDLVHMISEKKSEDSEWTCKEKKSSKLAEAMSKSKQGQTSKR